MFHLRSGWVMVSEVGDFLQSPSQNKIKMELNTELNLAKSLACEAGRHIMKYYSIENKHFTMKNEADYTSPVTKADLIANKLIVTSLRSTFKEDGILSEEEKDGPSRLLKKRVWIIDPLDGTKEFIAGSPEFTVNIALVIDHKPVLGVIYLPARDELYYASKEKGAFCTIQGKIQKMQVSNHKTFDGMVIVKSRLHGDQRLHDFLDENKFKSVLSIGSSLKGCLVAKAEADAYVRFGNTHEWDVCAMDCIVRQAGGTMTNLDGKILKYNQKNTILDGFIVSNTISHPELIHKIGKMK